MKDFHTLSIRGRALRLRRMAIKALEDYTVRQERVTTLTIHTNGIFRVDARGGRKFVLRISDPKGCHGQDELRSEMSWLSALSGETDLGVPRPVHTNCGDLITTVEVEGVPEARHCQLFSWIPGSDLSDHITTDNLSRLGRLTARLHIHAATYNPPDDFHIRTLDRVFLYSVPGFHHVEPVVLFDEEHREHMNSERRNIIQKAICRVEAVLEELYSNPAGLRVTHNDLHPWNVKVFRKQMYALDFEDLAWGYPVQDIATTFFYLQDREDEKQLTEAYREGYTSILPWPADYPGQIMALMAGRGIMLANYVLCSKEPEDRQIVPDYFSRMVKRLRDF